MAARRCCGRRVLVSDILLDSGHAFCISSNYTCVLNLANCDAILTLVNYKADVALQDKDGLTGACMELITFFSEKSHSDRQMSNQFSTQLETALHCAASRGFVHCLETLIALCGAEIDQVAEIIELVHEADAAHNLTDGFEWLLCVVLCGHAWPCRLHAILAGEWRAAESPRSQRTYGRALRRGERPAGDDEDLAAPSGESVADEHTRRLASA